MKRMLILLGLVLILLAGCKETKSGQEYYERYESLMDSGKPIAYGEDDDVYIFAEGAVLEAVRDTLEESVGRTETLIMDIKERYFQPIFASASDLDEFKPYKNLIYCGILDGTDSISKHINKTLDPQLIETVGESGAELFMVNNLYVKDQLVLYLLAKDIEGLQTLTGERKNQIFDFLLERYQKRLANAAYKNPVIESKFFEDRPFTIKVPVLYRLWKDEKSGRFVSFLFQPTKPTRHKADKYISVYYEPMSRNRVNEAWIYKTRQELGEKFIGGDQIFEDSYKTEKVQIAGQNGFLMRGHWVNPSQGGFGGAFQSWAFWHAPTKTAYLIDNIAYFPDGKKLPALLELGMLSQSIELK
ncbi:MAG: DUF4837 family protein [Candidatus Cloacimonetes bacterium]|nr:DUF4837 family protein [Candidatus Cloacimonadota bacterium]